MVLDSSGTPYPQNDKTSCNYRIRFVKIAFPIAKETNIFGFLDMLKHSAFLK